MRTIKRHSIEINPGKKRMLSAIARAYAKEKQYWLSVFKQNQYLPFIEHHRKIRDQAVDSSYQSSFGLQARMWKLALQEAADTMNKYWKSLFEKIKQDLHKSSLDASERHYVFWIMKDYARLEASFRTTLEFKDLPLENRKKAIKFLKSKIKKYKKQLPKVKLKRSFMLDDNCYDIFEHEGHQYIKIMTLIPRQRMAIPLSGYTPIKGNIKLVLKDDYIDVHYTADMKAKKTPIHPINQNHVMALDFGYSEVMTDSDGKQYGKDFGRIMKQASDDLKTKMQKRHQLHAIQKSAAELISFHEKKKANNISKFNLGRKKLESNHQKLKATLQCEINTAFNQLAEKDPDIVISELLSQHFNYNRGCNMNRRLSAWVRGELKERLEFKALAKGFGHEQVNPAYSSQICLVCDFVDRKNRKGDKFECQYCRYVSHADWVAAMNLKRRYYDHEITRFTPYREVKKILLERFHRQLETKKLGTVNGRTPDTTIA